MALEEFTFDAVTCESRRIGVEAALNVTDRNATQITPPAASIFGARWSQSFNDVFEGLKCAYGDKFEDLIFLSIRLVAYSTNKAAAVMSIFRDADTNNTTETIAALCTAQGYADSEGWAYTLYNCLSELDKPIELLSGTAFKEMPRTAHILDAISVYWFFEASKTYAHDSPRAIDLLFEAADAASLSNGMNMWDAAQENIVEEVYANSHSKAASALAKKRHAENYALADDAVRYWRENIDPNLPASKAAEQLLRVVPLSYKKLAELIAAERKKPI